ncbi:putative aminotransferase, partial [Aureobasidium melanogenum]
MPPLRPWTCAELPCRVYNKSEGCPAHTKVHQCHAEPTAWGNLPYLPLTHPHNIFVYLSNQVETALMASSESINLIKGWPSTSLLPTDHLSRAAHKALADTSVAFPGLLYGPDEGYTPLRESLATWLTSFYHPEQPIAKERITITGGASQNLACLLQVFTDPAYTRDILFAAPAYMLAFRVFEDNGFSGKMKAVPEDDDGMDMAALRRALEESEKRSPENKTLMFKPPRPYAKYYRHIIYCVPTFSNPSSRTLPLDRRIELVKLAREFDALRYCLVWSISTASSTVEQSALVQISLETRQVAAAFPKLQDLVCEWAGPRGRQNSPTESPKPALLAVVPCLSTFSRYYNLPMLHDTRPWHRQLRNIFILSGSSCRSQISVWSEAIDFAKRCQDEAQVIVAPGSIFEVPGDDSVKFEHSIRLTFSWIDEHLMVEAVKRISTVLERCLKGEATIEAPKQSKVSENPY